jgi:hypothetical protein
VEAVPPKHTNNGFAPQFCMLQDFLSVLAAKAVPAEVNIDGVFITAVCLIDVSIFF